jgi:endonuclease/exonuclease/phosphatase family metal-dependent hydrolase
MVREGVGGFGETLAARVEIEPAELEVAKIGLRPAAGPPGTVVTVDLLEGNPFSPRQRIRFGFGDPDGHQYSLVPVGFSWIDASTMSFTVPANAACGMHYVAVMAGARVATESASFEVDGACDPSQRRSFDVLSYNIQMLPDEACPPYTPVTDGCHKDYRAGLIISHPDLQGHDVVVFVEAFSDSHRDRILEGLAAEYPYHGEILGEDHGTVQDGGVIILSKWPIEEEDQDIFANCSGFADCHADKGVNYAKINKGGIPYHVFGTHLDAGGAPEDISTRHMQLAEMSTFVLVRRIPWFEAVLMAGDFNVDRNSSATEYHRMLRILRATPPERVGDATNPSGQWIDYVLYSAVHTLPIESLNEVRYPRDAGGGDLSDHYAVLGKFKYADSAIRSLGGQGGAAKPGRVAGMWRRFAV